MGGDMNYVRTILITTLLLSIYNLYNAEFSTDIQVPPLIEQSTFAEEEIPSEDTSKQETEIEEKNELQNWNDHLELLTTDGEYWDKENNIPSDGWKSTAFDLAEKVLKKDISLAETLKSDFLDAIQSKVTLEKGNQLIEEFDAIIKKLLAQLETEKKETVIPAPVVPEIVTPEPVSQPEPLPQPETPAAPQESTSTTQTPEQAPKDLSTEWKNQLKEVKQSGENWLQFYDILNKTCDIAKQILISEPRKQQTLQADFYDALQTRAIAGKKLFSLNSDQTMTFFNNSIGIFSPEEQSSYYQQSQQEALALQEKYAKEDALAKEEQEKQRQKEEQEKMKILAAFTKLEEEGKVSKSQVHAVVTELEKMKLAMAQKDAETKKQIKEAREALAKNMEQLAAAQKAPAEKGILSTFTEAVSNWWYGPGDQKPAGLSAEDQEKLLAVMPQGARERFKDFQNILLNFNAAKYWNQQDELPNKIWVKEIQGIVKDLVTKHQIISLPEVSTIVQTVLISAEKMSPANIKKTIDIIGKPVKDEQAKQQRQEAAKQQKIQGIKDKKEQILLAQQRKKDEQERREQEIKKHEQVKTSYKDEKKQWYDLLEQVAQNKQATIDANHARTQEAIQKSQTLLNLASNIPTKNKAAISQKLKQKFSVALLEQQKNNVGPVNIYQTMDLFNKEINKMFD